MDIGVLVGQLSDRIEALVAEILPHGVREGHEWRVGSVSGEAGRSMAVHLGGDRAGVWCDFGGRPNDRGDALDLVAAVLFDGDKKRGLRWARAWLGVDQIDRRSIPQQRRALAEKKARAVDEDKRKRGLALQMFIQAEERLAGTRAARYLACRGLDLAQLGRQPRCLRYARELVHPETGECAPALLAAITSADGDTVAVHRTFLEELADGSVVKLRGVEDPKLTLGRYAGGCIHLWRGASGKAWKDALPGEWLMIGEGLEDTLTAVIARPDLRAAVAVSLSNMIGLVVPAAIAGVILLAQNDAPGSPASDTLIKAVHHFHQLGKLVKIARPDKSTKDINELAQRAMKQG